jgi:hypothetical protein
LRIKIKLFTLCMISMMVKGGATHPMFGHCTSTTFDRRLAPSPSPDDGAVATAA